MHRRWTGDEQEMDRGCTGDAHEMDRRWTGDAQEMDGIQPLFQSWLLGLARVDD